MYRRLHRDNVLVIFALRVYLIRNNTKTKTCTPTLWSSKVENRVPKHPSSSKDYPHFSDIKCPLVWVKIFPDFKFVAAGGILVKQTHLVFTKSTIDSDFEEYKLQLLTGLHREWTDNRPDIFLIMISLFPSAVLPVTNLQKKIPARS